MAERPLRVAILGAGVSGLTAAWNLQRAGAEVRVLEVAERSGGVIGTSTARGFLFEHGPHEMLLKSAEMSAIFTEMGLDGELVEANPRARKRFIVRDNRPLPVPMGPLSFLGSPLFSLRAKLRLLREPFIPGRPDERESVGCFIRRRLGREFLDYAVGPLCSGVFAGDPECLSFRHCFPRLWILEERYGSLLRGALCKRREDSKAGLGTYPYRLVSFRQGMCTLPDHLTSVLGDSVHRGVVLESIQVNPWRVIWRNQGNLFAESFDALICTIPSYRLGSTPLPMRLTATLAPLGPIRYAPVSTLSLGFRREDVAHPLDGFGMLISSKANRRILGTLFNSTLFGQRAPEGHVNLTTFIGGMRQPELASMEDERLLPLVLGELTELLGVRGKPVVAQRHYWPRAIPQYECGYEVFLQSINQAERDFPGFYYAGNIRGGVGVGEVCLNAVKIGQRILDEFSCGSMPKPPSPANP